MFSHLVNLLVLSLRRGSVVAGQGHAWMRARLWCLRIGDVSRAALSSRSWLRSNNGGGNELRRRTWRSRETPYQDASTHPGRNQQERGKPAHAA
jgi:hypothetical protein